MSPHFHFGMLEGCDNSEGLYLVVLTCWYVRHQFTNSTNNYICHTNTIISLLYHTHWWKCTLVPYSSQYLSSCNTLLKRDPRFVPTSPLLLLRESARAFLHGWLKCLIDGKSSAYLSTPLYCVLIISSSLRIDRCVTTTHTDYSVGISNFMPRDGFINSWSYHKSS